MDPSGIGHNVTYSLRIRIRNKELSARRIFRACAAQLQQVGSAWLCS
jgi:hypothetical protein